MKSAKQNLIEIKDFYELNLLAIFAAFRKEHIAFKLLTFYFFLEYVRPQTLYPALDILPWTQLTLVFMLIAFFSFKEKRVSTPLDKHLIFFAFILIITSLFSFSPIDAWEYRNTMIGWFLVFMFVTKFVNTEQRFLLFILLYLLFSLKMGQHGAYSWVSRGFAFTKWGLVGAPGWFKNSGEFAIQMLIFGSLAISYVVAIKDHLSKFKRWIMYALAITGYMSVMGASSRGSQLGLAAIAIWFMLKQKNGFKGLIIVIIFSSILYNILPDEQMQRFTEMGEDRDSLQRFAYWEAGWEAIKENPILGIGYNNWMPYMLAHYPNGIGVMEVVQVSHNIYVQAASELGIIGLLSFLIMIFIAFKLNVESRALAKNDENKIFASLTYGLDAGLIGYLVAGSFVTVLYYPYFWIQISMIAALNSISRKKYKKMDAK